jgi:hypothetical protein
MTFSSSSRSVDLAEEWRASRALYPVYAALVREFVIEAPACGDLEAGVEVPPKESVEQARQWFLDVDVRIQVHQLRQFLQTTHLASEESLRSLLEHHLTKEPRTPSDRDKVDFLLVQFFSHCTPSGLEDNDVDLDYVAQVLEPVLGQVDTKLPAGLKPMEALLQSASKCRRLSELLHSGILEQGRKLKVQSGENYFAPAAMVAFARFSFMMRRVFFRLMHDDLNSILDGLRELEHRGIQTLDCRRAQFSADEPVARLRMICQSWKVMFHAEYSSGQPLRMLVDIRAAVDDALGHAGSPKVKIPAGTKAVGAAAAGRTSRGFATKPSATPEFEVAADPAHGSEPDREN